MSTSATPLTIALIEKVFTSQLSADPLGKILKEKHANAFATRFANAFLSALQGEGVTDESEVEKPKVTKKRAASKEKITEVTVEVVEKKLESADEGSFFNVETHRVVSGKDAAVRTAIKKRDMTYYLNGEVRVCGPSTSDALAKFLEENHGFESYTPEESKPKATKARKSSTESVPLLDRAYAALEKKDAPKKGKNVFNLISKKVHTDSDKMREKYQFGTLSGSLLNGEEVTVDVAFADPKDEKVVQADKDYTLTLEAEPEVVMEETDEEDVDIVGSFDTAIDEDATLELEDPFEDEE